jgi:hypothetical protein
MNPKKPKLDSSIETAVDQLAKIIFDQIIEEHSDKYEDNNKYEGGFGSREEGYKKK